MRIVRMIVGMLLLTAGLPILLAAGGLWTVAQHRDAGGAFRADLEQLDVPGQALIIEDLDGLLRRDAAFARTGRTGLRITAMAGDAPAFVGLAPATAATGYLRTARHTRFEHLALTTGPLPVRVSTVAGPLRETTGEPGREEFWTRSGDGSLAWTADEIRDRDLALVIMSPDGRPAGPITVTAELRPDWLTAATWGGLGGGLLLIITGMAVLAWPARPRELVYVVDPGQFPDVAARLGPRASIIRAGEDGMVITRPSGRLIRGGRTATLLADHGTARRGAAPGVAGSGVAGPGGGGPAGDVGASGLRAGTMSGSAAAPDGGSAAAPDGSTASGGRTVQDGGVTSGARALSDNDALSDDGVVSGADAMIGSAGSGIGPANSGVLSGNGTTGDAGTAGAGTADTGGYEAGGADAAARPASLADAPPTEAADDAAAPSRSSRRGAQAEQAAAADTRSKGRRRPRPPVTPQLTWPPLTRDPAQDTQPPIPTDAIGGSGTESTIATAGPVAGDVVVPEEMPTASATAAEALQAHLPAAEVPMARTPGREARTPGADVVEARTSGIRGAETRGSGIDGPGTRTAGADGLKAPMSGAEAAETRGPGTDGPGRRGSGAGVPGARTAGLADEAPPPRATAPHKDTAAADGEATVTEIAAPRRKRAAAPSTRTPAKRTPATPGSASGPQDASGARDRQDGRDGRDANIGHDAGEVRAAGDALGTGGRPGADSTASAGAGVTSTPVKRQPRRAASAPKAEAPTEAATDASSATPAPRIGRRRKPEPAAEPGATESGVRTE